MSLAIDKKKIELQNILVNLDYFRWLKKMKEKDLTKKGKAEKQRKTKRA